MQCTVHAHSIRKLDFPEDGVLNVYKSAIDTTLQLDGSLHWTEVCSPEVTITHND